MLEFIKIMLEGKRDEKGATAVEYGLMVALIAVAIIVAVTAARHQAHGPVQRHRGRRLSSDVTEATRCGRDRVVPATLRIRCHSLKEGEHGHHAQAGGTRRAGGYGSGVRA